GTSRVPRVRTAATRRSSCRPTRRAMTRCRSMLDIGGPILDPARFCCNLCFNGEPEDRGMPTYRLPFPGGSGENANRGASGGRPRPPDALTTAAPTDLRGAADISIRGLDPLLDELVAAKGVDEGAVAYLEELRWPDGVACPRCASDRSGYMET